MPKKLNFQSANNLTTASCRHPNSTKEIFTEALISIKAEAEQALAREVGCSVIAIPDYLDDSARDAIAAAASEVAFASSEPKHIIAASEAVRLAYDFGECSGKYKFRA